MIIACVRLTNMYRIIGDMPSIRRGTLEGGPPQIYVQDKKMTLGTIFRVVSAHLRSIAGMSQ